LINGLPYGKDPKQGFVENSVFYHPSLKIQFPIPNGWSYENGPQKFQMSPKTGDAVLELTLLKAKSIQEATTEIEQQYGIQTIENRSINVNGLNAISLEGNLIQQQSTLHTLSYVIQYAGQLFHMMGASSSNTYSNYLSDFNFTLQNFKEIKDVTKINKKVERIVLKEITRNGTVAQTLKSFGVQDNRVEEMAILNGMKPTDNVIVGSMIKIIGY
jgi:predicted Zn-dependent protease